jgi:hypothetical protein
MKALPIPLAAQRDEQAVEVLRAWIAEGGLHCAVRVGMHTDQGVEREKYAWGIMFADAVRHVADALVLQGFGSHDSIVRGIVDGFRAEIEQSTSGRSGDFVSGPN